MKLIIIFVVGLCIGVAIGFAVGSLRTKRGGLNNVGTLQIIQSKGEDPYVFLSLETSIESVIQNKIVALNVTSKTVSQK